MGSVHFIPILEHQLELTNRRSSVGVPTSTPVNENQCGILSELSRVGAETYSHGPRKRSHSNLHDMSLAKAADGYRCLPPNLRVALRQPELGPTHTPHQQELSHPICLRTSRSPPIPAEFETMPRPPHQRDARTPHASIQNQIDSTREFARIFRPSRGAQSGGSSCSQTWTLAVRSRELVFGMRLAQLIVQYSS